LTRYCTNLRLVSYQNYFKLEHVLDLNDFQLDIHDDISLDFLKAIDTSALCLVHVYDYEGTNF
jgi:hypothetical protein